MYNIIKNLSNGIKEYVCDSANDLNPTSDLSTIEVYYSAMGSRCYCISENQTYILNGNKQWIKIPKTGSNEKATVNVVNKSTLSNALASSIPEIKLTDNIALDDFVEIPEGKELTIDLNGKTLTTATNSPIEVPQGATLTLKNGILKSPKGAAVNAYGEGAKIVVDGATIDSSTSGNAIEVSEGGEVEVNSGSIKARETCVFPYSNAKVTINGGALESIDNAPIMPNGSADKAGYDITINGGDIIGNIQSSGYVACAIYAPNKGTITINGGNIKAENGAGIVVRGGTVNVNGGTITGTGDSSNVGKVGDSRVVVPAGSAIVYDSNSKYPDAANMKLVIGKDAKLVGELVELGDASGVTDNRTAE